MACIVGQPSRWKDAIHVLEARSILGAIKHRARDCHRHGKRITVLNDNLAVVLALQKGRCSNYMASQNHQANISSLEMP